jgi:hypothetical protein
MKRALQMACCLLLGAMSAGALAMPPPRPDKTPLTSLHVEPSGALVVGTLYGRFFRSVDGGSNWRAIGKPAGFPTPASDDPALAEVMETRTRALRDSDGYIGVIGVETGQGGVLYATTTNRQSPHWNSSIHRSDDGGQSWTHETFGMPGSWRIFALVRVLPNAIYFSAADQWSPGQPRGLYRSAHGAAAELMNFELPYGVSFDVQEGADGAIFLLTDLAIHRSDDGGKRWRTLSRKAIDECAGAPDC